MDIKRAHAGMNKNLLTAILIWYARIRTLNTTEEVLHHNLVTRVEQALKSSVEDSPDQLLGSGRFAKRTTADSGINLEKQKSSHLTQNTMTFQNEGPGLDYNDICPICRQLLYRPSTTTVCGHAACHACLLTWIATSRPEPRPLDASFQIFSEPEIDDVFLGCPMCRTETQVALDEARSSQLESKYPILYKERAMQETETEQLMIIQFGNTHKNVPPSISPYSGIARTHYWNFFLKSSHTDLIESVDLLLHETFQNRRFVTLRKPPFTKSSLGWGYFHIAAFITLREGWEWDSPDAVNSSSRDGGCKDRLSMQWMLEFGGIGSQSLALVRIRRSGAGDEILTSLRHLFNAG